MANVLGNNRTARVFLLEIAKIIFSDVYCWMRMLAATSMGLWASLSADAFATCAVVAQPLFEICKLVDGLLLNNERMY